MNATTASHADRRDNGQDTSISRRAILRGLIPAVAAAAGIAGLLSEADAATGASSAGHGRGNRRRHHEDRERGRRADRGRRPHRHPAANPSPAPAPAPAPSPAPEPTPAPVPAPVASITTAYSFDSSGNLTITGANFIPGVEVLIDVLGDYVPLFGSGFWSIGFSASVTPDASGSFTVMSGSLCPHEVYVTATQAGIPPVYGDGTFGRYVCLA